MKPPYRAVTINFASTNFRVLSSIRFGLAFAAGVFAVFAVLLILAARSYRHQGNAAEIRLRDLAASEEKLRPLMKERQSLVDNLNAMTVLLQARRFSWTRFLTHIEEGFPEGLELTRVDYRPRERTASLDGVAQSPDALSRLMVGLERSHWFKNPLLKRQSMEKGILSFNVTVVYNDTASDGTGQKAVLKQDR
jgi:Tfp pilus assembly protein PilN